MASPATEDLLELSSESAYTIFMLPSRHNSTEWGGSISRSLRREGDGKVDESHHHGHCNKHQHEGNNQKTPIGSEDSCSHTYCDKNRRDYDGFPSCRSGKHMLQIDTWCYSEYSACRSDWKKRERGRIAYQSSREWMTSPDLSLGSNQVVLGGMMLPESAISMSCFIDTG